MEVTDFLQAIFRWIHIVAGITWIGPAPESIADMGDKERARQLAEQAGVPILPGSRRFTLDDHRDLRVRCEPVGFDDVDD